MFKQIQTLQNQQEIDRSINPGKDWHVLVWQIGDNNQEKNKAEPNIYNSEMDVKIFVKHNDPNR
ncbi:MAG: hypothetical protein ACE5G1_11715 [bacterium]